MLLYYALGTIEGTIGTTAVGPLGQSLGAGELLGQFLVDVDTQTGLVVGVHVTLLELGAAGEDVERILLEAGPLLDTEVQLETSMWMSAAWPTGEVSPGPCHAVRTEKCSANLASLTAGVMPPI